MRAKEYKTLTGQEKNGVSAPQGTEEGIHHAMLRLIGNAGHFIYIENQFFVSHFGKLGPIDANLSPAAQFIKNGDKGISDTAMNFLRRWDDVEGEGLDALPKNGVCKALIARIHRAIIDDTQPNFHVYITLPVHSEGSLDDPTVAVQIFWTVKTLVGGSHSLLNGIRRSLKANELRRAKKPYQRALDDPGNTEYEDIPLEACFKYVTLLNLRTWEKLGERYVTEQIYVHSKLMIVDDRFALLGSANINDRSLLGERDSELALLVIDSDQCKADIGHGRQTPVRSFAREFRMGVWKKLFGITGGVRPASHLQRAIEQPVNPASWQAIQKQAGENAAAYEGAFDFVPRNWVLDINNAMVPASILPTWDSEEMPPVELQGKWGKGYLKSPLPFQSQFWDKPRHNPDGVSALANIKGFITALPIHWTKGENIHFKYPTSLVVENDQKPTGTKQEPAWDSAQGSATEKDHSV